MRRVYFTPGPSALYYTADHHIKYAIKHGITSISHRSKTFQDIFKEAESNLKILLALPDNYQLVFTNSATEIWEKMTDAFISNQSLHMVNGAFSKKFYTVAKNLGKKANIIESPWGELPDFNIDNKSYDLIGVTHNETSTGVKTPLKSIYSLRKSNPEALIAIDAVSSLPVLNLDYTKVDTVYASVQKAFGLPAGLGVWLVNDRAEEKALKMKEDGLLRDTFHNVLSLIDQARKYQTPSTPNILGIYLFSQVVKDMIDRGLKQIRNDSVYKSAIMYNMLDQHDILQPFVNDKSLRSETIIVVDSGSRTKDLINFLSDYKMEVGNGYGKMKDKQVRIANFPTHSKEQFELLVDLIDKFE
ncbi:MAG: phosphoserine aminotransferase [Bacteroidetes bacterium]|nr:MAG: phosphoserine aminotransferase [Bacteroidota bacterium]